MARKIIIFQNFEKMSIFKFAYFYSLSVANQFYYCFILDITCTLVPANELVSIWCNLDRVSILVSILHLSLDLRKKCKARTMKMLKI